MKIAENGRLSLPIKERRLVGLECGGVVAVRVENGEIRIRPIQTLVDEMQNIARKYFSDAGDNVDRFIADRHEEEASNT